MLHFLLTFIIDILSINSAIIISKHIFLNLDKSYVCALENFMLWINIINQIKEEGTITKRVLKIVPLLRTCSNWFAVTPLGKINYSSTITRWDGFLVEFSNQLFYVDHKTYEIIKNQIKWKVKNEIKVIQK